MTILCKKDLSRFIIQQAFSIADRASFTFEDIINQIENPKSKNEAYPTEIFSGRNKLVTIKTILLTS